MQLDIFQIDSPFSRVHISTHVFIFYIYIEIYLFYKIYLNCFFFKLPNNPYC